jgi:hypothetical protein
MLGPDAMLGSDAVHVLPAACRIDPELMNLARLQEPGMAIISRPGIKKETRPRHFQPFGKVCY